MSFSFLPAFAASSVSATPILSPALTLFSVSMVTSFDRASCFSVSVFALNAALTRTLVSSASTGM